MILFDVAGKVSTLLARLTDTRATALDLLTTRLDSAVSTRAPATDTTTLLSRLSSARSGYLDNLQFLSHTMRPPTSINQGHGKSFPSTFNRGYLPGQTSTVSCTAGVETTLFSISGPAPGGIINFFSFYGTNSSAVSATMKIYVDGVVIQTLSTTLQNVYQHTVVGAAISSNLNVNDVMVSLGLLRFNTSFSVTITPSGSTISVQYNTLWNLY